MSEPLVSIIVPTHNRKKKLERLIKSILESSYPVNNIEIIVVDDASSDGTFEYIKAKFANVNNLKVIRNEQEKLASGAKNIGIRHAVGKYVFFVDDDNVMTKNTIKSLVKAMNEYPDIGLCGSVSVYYSNPNIIWCAGAYIKRPLYTMTHFMANKTLQELYTVLKIKGMKFIYCDYIPNAYMTRREIVHKIGGFDEENFPIAWEEIDLAIRIRKLGYKIAVVPNSIIMHDIPFSEKSETSVHLTPKRSYYRGRSRVRFYIKYSKIRLLGVLLDLIGFVYNSLRFSMDKYKIENITWYVRGVINGLTGRGSRL